MEQSAQRDTTRAHKPFLRRKVQVRVGFCGLSSVRPPPSDVTPEHEVAYLTSFPQDGGFWDSLEHGFVSDLC